MIVIYRAIAISPVGKRYEFTRGAVIRIIGVVN